MRSFLKAALKPSLALLLIAPAAISPAQTPSPTAPTPAIIPGPGSTLSQAPRSAPNSTDKSGRKPKRKPRHKKDEVMPYGLPLMARFDLLPVLRDTKCVQDSSYDPSGGNGDSGHFLRKEGNKAILADIKGPGCIYRFWSANAAGTLRIYFDGESSPRIECPMQDFFLGKVAPFTAPLVGHKSGGWYSYFPMPFEKSCRIEVTNPENMYYHVEYQLMPDDTPIRTFTTTLTSDDSKALAAVTAQWNRLGDDPKPLPKKTTVLRAQTSLAPGETRTLGDIKGGGEVSEIRLKITPADRQTLRQTLLRVYWDNASRPAIEAPVGDFFGVGFGNQTVKALPTALTEAGGVCYWPMPFGKGAHFELANRGKTALPAVEWSVTYTPLPKNKKDLAYFHAQFHRQKTVAGEPFHILQTSGRGHYVGEHTDMQGDRGIWFLEGDEKVYVDGETFPSIYGTGSEDFYTGGWYFDQGPFNLAYHGCAVKSDDLSRISAYRYQILDCVPFSRDFKIDIEHGNTNDYPGADYSCVAYWYLDARDHDWSPTSDQDLAVAHFQAANVLEAEKLTWAGRQIQDVDDSTLPLEISGGKGVALTGDKLAFTFPVEAEDVYRVRFAYVAQANNPDAIHANVTDALEGTPEAKGFDLPLTKPGTPGRADTSFTAHLTPGRHNISLTVPTGKTVLLDYVKLERSRKENGVTEVESLEKRADTGGNGDLAPTEGPDAYSGRTALTWRPTKTGATLKMPISVTNAGDYTLELALDRGPNAPQVAARIDDGPDFPTIDLYGANASLSQRLRIGTLTNLQPGEHTLTLTYKGKNNAVTTPAVTFDYIRLQKSKIPNAVEAEAMKVLEAKDGDAKTQDMAGFGPNWSGNSQFWFLGSKVGSEATLELPVTYAGRYNIGVYFTGAKDYGTIQTLIDGKEIGLPVDCYAETVSAKDRASLGTVDLTAGSHRITFRIVGKNAAASGYLIGVDAIALDPVK